MPISREVRTIALKKYVRGKSQAVTANFTSGEFDCKGRRCGCTVTGLDSRLVRKLQVMRRLTGRPITVNSGSRCPTHNRDVGGTSGSYHLAAKGMAADIAVRGMTPAATARLAQELGFTGIGCYDGTAGRFVHVDVRPGSYYWLNTGSGNKTVSGHGGRKAVNPYAIGKATLRRGSKGAAVRGLQWALNHCGYTCAVDGDFGAKTDAAVREFQRNMLLTVDGIAGPVTLEAVREASV